MHKDIVKAAILASGSKFITLTFQKKDGTVRKVNGRFNVTSKTVSGKCEDLKVVLDGSDNPLIPFWSPREGWKSFYFNNILGVNTLKTKVLPLKGVLIA